MFGRLIENLWKALWADVERQHDGPVEEMSVEEEAIIEGRVPHVPSEPQTDDVFIIPAQPLFWNRIGRSSPRDSSRDFWRNRDGRPLDN